MYMRLDPPTTMTASSPKKPNLYGVPTRSPSHASISFPSALCLCSAWPCAKALFRFGVTPSLEGPEVSKTGQVHIASVFFFD